MERVRIGVLGCGIVSRQYLPILTKLASIDVLEVADIIPERAEEAREQFGIAKTVSPDQLFADPNIEIVVNLTPLRFHVETTSAALEAGKHVYSEKSLAATAPQATKLLELASAHHCLLACAPDTLLGSGFSAARSALEGGTVGAPLAAGAFMIRAPLKTFPTPGEMEAGMPFYEMATYYLSALVNLFGPAQSISAYTRLPLPGPAGFDPQDEVMGAASIQFASGLVAGLELVWGTKHSTEVPFIVVFGTEGELRISNPNAFDGPSYVRRYEEAELREIANSRQPSAAPLNLRGLGVSDLAHAVRERRAPRAAGDIAAHAVEIVDGLVSSARSGKRVELVTTCRKAASLSDGEREHLLAGSFKR